MATECDLWIGDCYYRQGKYTEASKAYSDYLRYSGLRSSNRMLATYDLGYSRFGEKRYSEARQNFEKVVKQPGNLGQDIVADSYNRIGDCHYYASAFSEAAANYDKAYSLNPEAGDYALFQKAMMRGLKTRLQGQARDNRRHDVALPHLGTYALGPSRESRKLRSTQPRRRCRQGLPRPR